MRPGAWVNAMQRALMPNGTVHTPHHHSPEEGAGGAAAAAAAGESKLWRPKRQSSTSRLVLFFPFPITTYTPITKTISPCLPSIPSGLASVGMVAAASIISAAAAAISVPAASNPSSPSNSGGSSSALAALLGLVGFAPTADAARSSAASAASFLPRWLAPAEDDPPLPGEGLVLLALGLLAVSILCAYPNPHFSLPMLWRGGAGGRGKGQQPGEVCACVRACVRCVIMNASVGGLTAATIPFFHLLPAHAAPLPVAPAERAHQDGRDGGPRAFRGGASMPFLRRLCVPLFVEHFIILFMYTNQSKQARRRR